MCTKNRHYCIGCKKKKIENKLNLIHFFAIGNKWICDNCYNSFEMAYLIKKSIKKKVYCSRQKLNLFYSNNYL